MFKNAFFAALVLALFSMASCQINETFVFDKNYGGEGSFTINIAQYLQVVPDTGTVRADFYAQLRDKLGESLAKLEGIEGISNAHYSLSDDSTEISLVYHFANLQTLNLIKRQNSMNNPLKAKEATRDEAENTDQEVKPKPYYEFEQKGKQFIYRYVTQEELNPEAPNVSGQMDKMMKYNLTFVFAQAIKSVNLPEATIDTEKNSVSISFNAINKINRELIVDFK